MTLGIAMYFSDTCGAIISDRQGSYGKNLSTTLYNKRFEVTDGNGIRALVSTAGNSNLVSDVLEQLDDEIELQRPKILKPKHLAQVIRDTVLTSKSGFIDRYLSSQLRVSFEEAREAGLVGPGSQLDEYNDISLLILTVSNGKIDLYQLEADDGSVVPRLNRPHVIIGDGGPSADAIIAQYLENSDWSRNKGIDPYHGLCTMLRAYQFSSQRHNSVGGTPSIAIVDNGTILTPTSDQAKLALHALNAGDQKIFHRDYVKDLITQSLYNNGDVDTLLFEMLKKSHNMENEIELIRLLADFTPRDPKNRSTSKIRSLKNGIKKLIS
jgi:hypothetical protein